MNSWTIWIALQLARLAALWTWAQATELRRGIVTAACTLAIALLAWVWPFGIWILIGVQVARSTRPSDRIAACLIAIIACCGCTPDVHYRALPVPPAEHPVVNLPLELRQSNWRGPRGEGSCVHASLTNMLRWQNEYKLAEEWKRRYKGDGEHASELRSRLDEMGIKYAYTENSNLALLDMAHETRLGALLWWKTSHCCTFCGWVVDANGREYAVILDNNSVQQYELTEKSQFHKAWASFGGFALTTLGSPPSLLPYRSYEAIGTNF